jgi:hypothetical protein
MKPSVVAVEAKDSSVEHLRATDPGAKAEGPPAVRFLYPSGSQPLPGYTVKRGIGHGGFGEVYYAVSDAGKEVALKLIRRNLDVELRGIRHCLNLKHPNLLAIHDIRRDEHGDNWVIMEYINGQRLEDVIAAHPQGMPRDQALAWLFGAGAGVACLHDHGIVHRDLKPGNIFCDEGVVKLGDYGLSKFISCSRRSGQTESVGTVHYMAPEIANGRYGKEIDIYALGVIFYEMLTGRVPFEGESVGEVLMKHLTTEPDVSGLAEPFRGVIAKALQKDPAKRFKSVPEMLAALPRPQRTEIFAGPLPSAGSGREGATITATVVPAAGAIPVAEAVDEEPIFRALRQGYRRARDAWDRSSFNTPTKIALLVVGSLVLLMSSASWMPVLVFLVLLYACYWVVRAVLTALAPPQRAGGPSLAAPLTPAAQPRAPGDAGGQPGLARAAPLPSTGAWGAAAPPHHGAWHRRRLQPHDSEADMLVLGSPRERATQLVGSLIGGALVTLTMCLVMLVLNSYRDGAAEPALWGWQWWAQYAWLVTVSLAGTWAVLIPSKFWEGRPGDAMLRRFFLMVVGLGLGLVAFWATGWFAVDLTHDSHFMQLVNYHAHRTLHPADGWDAAKYYLAAFGTLLLVIRWWRLADPARTARLSLWSLFVCVFLAALTADIWGFPQPWLPMAACSISVAVQLAGTWIHPRDRRWQSPPA